MKVCDAHSRPLAVGDTVRVRYLGITGEVVAIAMTGVVTIRDHEYHDCEEYVPTALVKQEPRP